MLSMKAKYALRALMVLAKSKQDMTQSKQIAKEAGVPIKFLENILQELKRNHQNVLYSSILMFNLKSKNKNKLFVIH